MIPRQEDVELILGPFHDQIYDIVDGAWQDWLSSSEYGYTRSSRTRACIVWDRMIGRAIEAFCNNPSVRCVEHYNTYSFIVNRTVLFRFKKGNQDGYTANYPTQTALAFHDHDLQLNLFGPGDYMRVQIVYTLDSLQTELDRVLIVARDNLRIAWDYEILPGLIPVQEIPPLQMTPERPKIVSLRHDGKVSRNGEQ